MGDVPVLEGKTPRNSRALSIVASKITTTTWKKHGVGCSARDWQPNNWLVYASALDGHVGY